MAHAMRSMPPGMCTQPCIRSSYTEKPGTGNDGSAKLPTGMATAFSMPDIVQYTAAPPFGQNLKVAAVPSSPMRANSMLVPLMATASFAKRARTPDTLPVRRWQARQWHADARNGAAVTRA